MRSFVINDFFMQGDDIRYILRLGKTRLIAANGQTHIIHIGRCRNTCFIAENVLLTAECQHRKDRAGDQKAFPFPSENLHALLDQHFSRKISDHRTDQHQDNGHDGENGDPQRVPEKLIRDKGREHNCRTDCHAVFEDRLENRNGDGIACCLHTALPVKKKGKH